MSDLSDDLVDLERELAARAQPEPSTTLRPRVLAAIRHELERESNGIWRYAAALAAVVLVGANLSLSAALDMGWPRDAIDAHNLAATAAQLRELDSAMSEQEARRQALLLQARSQLTLVPSLEQLLRDRQVQPLPPD